MTRILLALPALLLTLAACGPVVVLPTEPDGGNGSSDSCGAAGLTEFLGQDASVIAATLFTNPIRVIRPGEMVTMEFNPNRINFEVDGEERIVRIYCG